MNTTPLPRLFFKTLTSSDCELFECSDAAEYPTFLPARHESTAPGQHEQALLKVYEAIGRVVSEAFRYHPSHNKC